MATWDIMATTKSLIRIMVRTLTNIIMATMMEDMTARLTTHLTIIHTGNTIMEAIIIPLGSIMMEWLTHTQLKNKERIMAHKKKAHGKKQHKKIGMIEPIGKPKGAQHLKAIKKGHKDVSGK